MATLRKTRKLISTQRIDQSVTRATTITGQVSELFPLWLKSTQDAQENEDWYRNVLKDDDKPITPAKTQDSVKDLREFSSTPWAKMIADGMSQDFIVDDIRETKTGASAPALALWQQNGLDARQKPVHDGAIRHGKAFNLIGRAESRLDGSRTAFIRGKSALSCDAFFRDDFDEYPEVFLEGQLQRDLDGTEHWRFDFYDDVSQHRLTSLRDGSKMTYIDYEPHDMGICPAVRAAGNIDLTGRVVGEIEPYITLFKRINQSTMDRLVVQRHGAFIIRWLAGIAEPATDEERRAAAIALSMTDLLMIPSENGKAGSLAATPLDGYIKSREADIRDLSATSQTASFHMLGLSDNVGAEGLAAAEASHTRKCDLWKVSLGEFWETSVRLAGHAAGRPEIASDFMSRVHWKDTSAGSFQSLAQGLGALATQLGIPGEVLWPRITDWGQADTELAKKITAKNEAKAAMDAQIAADAAATVAAAAKPQNGVSGGSATPAG